MTFSGNTVVILSPETRAVFLHRSVPLHKLGHGDAIFVTDLFTVITLFNKVECIAVLRCAVPSGRRDWVAGRRRGNGLGGGETVAAVDLDAVREANCDTAAVIPDRRVLGQCSVRPSFI